jgi:hypothetical protein
LSVKLIERISTPSLHTRLPAVGTTVFSLMSALASEHGAVNLGQGFPDFGCEPALSIMLARPCAQVTASIQ